MAFQKVFKKAYAEKLYEEARNGTSIEKYKADKFEYDEDQTYYAARVIQPEGLVERMPIDDDYAAAIALYEAYKNLTPLQASDHAFWIYLSHADLFSYIQRRYNKLDLSNNQIEFVLSHWFFTRELVRHALAGLWWNVYCTIDEGAEDKYKYTRMLFSRYDLRMIRFANYKMFRHKEQALGMLSFWMDHPEVLNDNSIRFYTKYFNKLGGTKQLICLKRDFFYKEMERILPEAMNYNVDNDEPSEVEELVDESPVFTDSSIITFDPLEVVDSSSDIIVENEESVEPHPSKSFEDYKEMIMNLKINKMNGYTAPHKPVLLYTVFTLIDLGVLKTNTIQITEELESTFENIWFEKVGIHPVYKCSLETPFYHMGNEPFWTLISNENWVKKTAYTLNDIKKYYKGAEIPYDLYVYMQDSKFREELMHMIDRQYFSIV